jgi:hypothetical protein
MPQNSPLTSAGNLSLDRRPRPVPKKVKDAITLMVRGNPDDPDGAPLTFIEAAKIAGVQPDQMRRWLDKPEVRKFLRAERQAWRAAICAGNESALKRVRDESANAMASVRAIQTLENIDEADRHHEAVRQRAPGFVILVAGRPMMSPSSQPPIDVTPEPVPDDDEGSPVDD